MHKRIKVATDSHYHLSVFSSQFSIPHFPLFEREAALAQQAVVGEHLHDEGAAHLLELLLILCGDVPVHGHGLGLVDIVDAGLAGVLQPLVAVHERIGIRLAQTEHMAIAGA